VVHDIIRVRDDKFLDKCLKLITKEEHEKPLKKAPGSASSSSSTSSDDSKSSGSTTTVGDKGGENILEEASDKEVQDDSDGSKEEDSEEEEPRTDPTPEQLDDQSRARSEDAGKEGGGRCFRCKQLFSAVSLIVHQCRMFHSKRCLSKFKDSVVYPTPAGTDLTKHLALPGTPARELMPTALTFDSPVPAGSKTSLKPKGQAKKRSAGTMLKNKMSAAKSKAAKAKKRPSSVAGSRALVDCLDKEGAEETAK